MSCSWPCSCCSRLAAPDIESDHSLSLKDVSIKAYPNPFSDKFNFTFVLPDASDVMLEVFRVSGERVALLFNGMAEANNAYTTEFDSRNLSEGFYIYRLQTDIKSVNLF